MPLLRIIDEELMRVSYLILPGDPDVIRVILKASKDITVKVQPASGPDPYAPLAIAPIRDDGSVGWDVYTFELNAGVAYAGYVYAPMSNVGEDKAAFVDVSTNKVLCVTRNSQEFRNNSGPS